jgi:chromosome segregation ATPase
MSEEIKAIAIGVGVILLALAGYFGYRSAYDSGQTAGKAETQILWDADRIAIQKVADDAIAENTKEKEAALAANEGITNDLQNQLSSIRDLSGNLAMRLRDAESRAAASAGSLSQANDKLRTASGALNASLEQINGAVADTINECGANNAKYTALVKELRPQL